MSIKEINPLYFQEEIQVQLKESLKQSKPQLLHIPHFFSISFYESLLKEVENSKEVHTKIPDKYSYSNIATLDNLNFLKSKDFIRWLSDITGKKIEKIKIQIKKYGHKDYLLLHDSETIGEHLEFFILVMSSWDNRWGGYTVYVSQNQVPIIFPLEGNSFSLIAKEKDRHKFIQYINHYAGREKLTIIEGIAE